jgi:hypothetical protein
MSELQIGDSVKLPGYSSYVKISEIRESEDRFVVEFAVNNSTTNCTLLKEMLPFLEPFDVKPATLK